MRTDKIKKIKGEVEQLISEQTVVGGDKAIRQFVAEEKARKALVRK